MRIKNTLITQLGLILFSLGVSGYTDVKIGDMGFQYGDAKEKSLFACDLEGELPSVRIIGADGVSEEGRKSILELIQLI